MIDATVVADSLCHNGSRIVTMTATFPRFLLAELNTHRAFSRNAASSRAIPTKRLLRRSTYVPERFGQNRAGMSAGEELGFWPSLTAEGIWKAHGALSRLASGLLGWLGIHKQWANRLSEPHMYVTVLITSTEWMNFLRQRMSMGAQPEMQELATKIQLALVYSQPSFLKENSYHLPFVTEEEKKTLELETQKLISVARCARVSYLNHDKTSPSVEQDVALAHKLLFPKDGPSHWSSFEHVARPTSDTGIIISSMVLSNWRPCDSIQHNTHATCI